MGDTDLPARDAGRLSALQQRAFWMGLNMWRRLGLAPPTEHNLGLIGYIRRIQSTRETGARRNPDVLVGRLLTPFENGLASVEDIEPFRANPLYHYVLARTRFYDSVLRREIERGTKQFLLIGAGMDTRVFRFRSQLDEAGMRVIETDLDPWMKERNRRCRWMKGPRDYIRAPLNLESISVADWMQSGLLDPARQAFILAEGVTPYITRKAYASLLALGAALAPGSRLYYDGKFEGRGPAPAHADPLTVCRLPVSEASARATHEAAGLTLARYFDSATLQQRFTDYEAPVFAEDVMIEAHVP